jgi:hypothetical protein
MNAERHAEPLTLLPLMAIDISAEPQGDFLFLLGYLEHEQIVQISLE